jgi:hypothetical protein
MKTKMLPDHPMVMLLVLLQLLPLSELSGHTHIGVSSLSGTAAAAATVAIAG